ncbi:MAG: glycosyltransferase [Pedobacter sp.]|nr:MAG: glycosyltransferase [Pedobacter sp.]
MRGEVTAIADVSVLTIVKNRTAAVLNLINGLAQGTAYPAELVVVFMNEDIPILPEVPFAVHCFELTSAEALPLAKARNHAVEKAKGKCLIFLDVDCIPSADLVNNFSKALKSGVILSGRVRYLEKDAELRHFDDDLLNRFSKPDPIRADINPLPYELFWSLNFGCGRNTFLQIGGFDEEFHGYGAEDTDFSFRAREFGVAIENVNATAYHQYHASYTPPLNHFSDIIHNANVFFQKWGKWPMEGWLHAFQQLGYITWTQNSIHVLKIPKQDKNLRTIDTL